MKKIIIVLLALVLCSLSAFSQWKAMGDKIKTEWASEINVNSVLPEYPRPLMERQAWLNLNGLWDYSILPIGTVQPTNYQGKILVPFPVESSLSGVQKELGQNNELWYHRSFEIPSDWKNKNIILHFGAVDWKAEVFINGVFIGEHKGGYAPFSFDITPFLDAKKQNLTVKVWDPTDEGYQPRGKQVNSPKGIWYSPVSGIWQTVWLEPVNKKHITALKTIPNIDNQTLSVEANISDITYGDILQVVVSDGGKVIARQQSVADKNVTLTIPNAKHWSPESPFLYDVEISLISGNKVVDEIKSYAAMRKISTKRDVNGVVRLQLNNKDYFQFGPLDQGWWPDGLYTAPSDEALVYDIQKTKDLGFNMIRKHVKVEPARWYTHCDRIGLLVWQDMPNGGISPQWVRKEYFKGNDVKRTAESEQNYRNEWKEIMDFLISYPSIVTWVPFNEAWGQFKTEEIAEWTKAYDPSRLVNPASGGNHYQTGDMLDLHNYPEADLYLYDAQRATVLGEYGGIGLPLEGHLWQPEKNWGYIQFKTKEDVTNEYIKYAEKLKKLIKSGFSAAVYTQTTDVEGEVNGLITYDRKEVKVDEERIKKVNQEICNILKVND